MKSIKKGDLVQVLREPYKNQKGIVVGALRSGRMKIRLESGQLTGRFDIGLKLIAAGTRKLNSQERLNLMKSIKDDEYYNSAIAKAEGRE